MKKVLIIIISSFLINNFAFAAGGDSGSDTNNYLDQYKAAKQLVNRGKKLESKGKDEKALKLYNSAYKKLLEAYKIESRNPDILNYLGFTLRKIGNFDQAEKYYLQGLEIKPNHNGINEYLGELYVQTDRIEKAKERLAVLKNCNCKEFQELELIIKTRGSKIY